jgi:multidrug efflux pump
VLSTAYGSAVINEFPNAGRLQRVVVQADKAARMTPEALLRLYVPNAQGEQVPLASFASVKWEQGAGADLALQRLSGLSHRGRCQARPHHG